MLVIATSRAVVGDSMLSGPVRVGRWLATLVVAATSISGGRTFPSKLTRPTPPA